MGTHSAAESVCSSQLNSWMPVTSTPLTSGTVPFSSTSPKIHQRPTILLERTQTSSRRGDRLKELYEGMPTSPHLVPDHDAARNPDYGGVWRTGWCPQIHDE